MNDEQFEQKMAFIVETLARVSVNDEMRQQEYGRHERRMDRLERVAKLMVRAGLREREQRRQQTSQFDLQFARVNQALQDLAEAQQGREASIAHTDSKLDALVDIVRQRTNGDS